jgi:phosphoribosylanthranilate isomerase
VARIGVFVNPSAAEVAEATSACGLTAVQLSGTESPELCAAIGVPVFKAVHVGTDFDSEVAEPFRGRADALLLDTYVAGKAGGTSQAFDWQRLGALPGWAPIFIAGGLNQHNVAACISALRPFGVDVSSGVEASPGIKDPEKIIAFVAAVRDADQEA